jgi:hypothetical protein
MSASPLAIMNTPTAGQVTLRWESFPTPLNTPVGKCMCYAEHSNDPLLLWFSSASKNRQMPEARARFAELMREWNALGVPPVHFFCDVFMMQLVRDKDWAGAMDVFDMCVARGVAIVPRVFHALLDGMQDNPESGLQSERILRVLRSLASSCVHGREQFATKLVTAIRGLIREHRFVDSMRLFDLLLDMAQDSSDQRSVGLGWEALFKACADYAQAVQAIALWRVAPRFERCTVENRALLVHAVFDAVAKIQAGAPQVQQAVGWAANESLVPIDWLRFIITDAVDGAGSQLFCGQATLKEILDIVTICQSNAMAIPLSLAAIDRPVLFGVGSMTFITFLRFVETARDRQLESLADGILAAARERGQLSSIALGHFMMTMINLDRADKVLETYKQFSEAQSEAINARTMLVVLAAVFVTAGPGDRRFAELDGMYNLFAPNVKNLSTKREMRVIVHAAATQRHDQARFAATPTNDAQFLLCYSIQNAIASGDFASALRDMETLTHFMRIVHFTCLVEKIVHASALPAAVKFARQYDIGWSPTMVLSVVRLCHVVENIAFAVEFVASFEEAQRAKKNRSSSELDVFRSQLLNSLRENGPQQLALMIKLLNAWVARGPVEADHASIVVVAAFRAAAHNLGWQVYRTLIEKTQSLSDVHCASVIREGVRFVDELWAVMDEFEEHGVTMSGEVWTSAFDTIDKRMRSSALAMQAFERMNQQQPVVNAASAYASAIGCLDALVSVEAVLAHMRAAQVTPNASLFLAVLRFCRRELQLELAERMMLEYIRTDDAAWYIDIFRVHEEIVGAVAAVAFQRQHAEAIGVKRSGVKASRLAPVSNDDHVQKRRAL